MSGPRLAPAPVRRRVLLTAAAGLLLLTGCRRASEPTDAPPPAADAVASLPRVRLQLDWYPQAEHGGFFQAQAAGHYRAAGLDVELLSGGPGPRTGARVVSGAAELGIHRSDDILAHAAEGLPFVIVGVFMQRDPQALLLHAGDPADSFAALDGRALMAVPGSNWIRYLQHRYGIEFRLVPHNWSLTQFFANPRLVQQCFITSEPYVAQQQGVPVKTLLIAGSGYDPYRVIFTTRRFLAEHPDQVRAFVRASVGGWRDYVAGDPRAAHEAILARNDQLTPDFLASSHAALRQHRLVEGERARGEDVGHFDRARLAEQIALLTELGVLGRPMAVEDVVDPVLLGEGDAPLAPAEPVR